MEALTQLEGVAAPLLRANVDTDQILPARFMIGLSDDGLGAGLFADWRYLPDGALNPGFILNIPPFDRSVILLAGANFGCGSSREHAPRAMRQGGVRCVIAPSFAGIFFNNAFRNGILPVVLEESQVKRLAALTADGSRLRVDLESQNVFCPDGTRMSFTTPVVLRQMLLSGADEVELTRAREPQIRAFRAMDKQRRPWAYTAQR
ncbi:MAG: 3-isopropylmalate dehydratase small subunit [Rhodoferax sp.]